MSAGYGAGGGSFSRGGSSRKVRRKKKDFHGSKGRFAQGEEPVDLQTLKERTLQSLDRLGHQVFPPDLAYGLESWLKSLNVLLDDFETKASPYLALPPEYQNRRLEVTSSLLKAYEFPELDSAIVKAKGEERQAVALLGGRDSSYFGSKLGALRSRREQVALELESERSAVTRMKSARKPSELLKRLLGPKAQPSVGHQANVSRLESELGELNAKASALESEQVLFKEAKEKLALASDRLAELEVNRLGKMQFAPEREEATRLLAEEIAKMNPS